MTRPLTLTPLADPHRLKEVEDTVYNLRRIGEATKSDPILDAADILYEYRCLLKSMLAPMYTHDCDACTFVGHIDGFDLYCCYNPNTDSTSVIARFDSDGPNYISYPHDGLRKMISETVNKNPKYPLQSVYGLMLYALITFEDRRDALATTA